MSRLFFQSVAEFWGAGALSLLASVVIVSTRDLHLSRTSRGHAKLEVQSVHTAPTPRVGGIALMFGMLAAAVLAPPESSRYLWMLLCSCIPVFSAGLMEDLNVGASPRTRLFAAMASSALMILLTGYHIPTLGIPALDGIMRYWPVGVLFTVFATAGVSHAFNLVDGLNGLAMSIGIVAACALGMIAVNMGDQLTATIAAALVLCVAGVLVLNYPLGRLFLGDAGAYTLGHLIAWIAVLLMARNPEVSPWAVLMAAFWPVMDTGAAVLRRLINRTPASAPDRMHFHHVVMRVIRANLPAGQRLVVANSLATAVMVPLFVAPGIIAVLTATNNLWAFLAFSLYVLVYISVRGGLVRSFRAINRRLTILRHALAPSH
ncbi:MraY family glycosyltransferase [Antarcticimicrobium sediminis]|nr:glycosyltransferase [Antarcticimicrobium sediminis]